MKDILCLNSVWISSIALSLLVVFTAETVLLAEETHEHFDAESQRAALALSRSGKKVIVKWTEQGLNPQTLKIKRRDSSVFFLNTSRDSKVDIAIDFGRNRTHCWSHNLELDAQGIMKTKKPIEPKDFVVLCFPEGGSYKITASGKKPGQGEDNSGKAVNGVIVVQ